MADASSEAGVDQLFDIAIEQLQDIHVLINNIGSDPILEDKPLIEISLADWNAVMAAFLRQPFLLSRRVIGEFLAGGEGGRIVHITTSFHPRASYQACHGAVATALRALTRSLAKEYGNRRIACNAIVVPDDLSVSRSSRMHPQEPSERGNPEYSHLQVRLDAAVEAVLFLASDGASFVNGEMLRLEGINPRAYKH